MNSLNQAIEASFKNKLGYEADAEFSIEVEGEAWRVYTVSIDVRDILCFCDKGTATFLVDSYGDRNVAELFDWERD